MNPGSRTTRKQLKGDLVLAKLKYSGVFKPRRAIAHNSWYGLVLTFTVLYALVIYTWNSNALPQLSMGNVILSKPEFPTSNTSTSYVPYNGSGPQQDVTVAALSASLQLDQNMVQKQILLVSNPKSFLILHTTSWSVRVATMIAYWGSVMVRREGFMHVVYHGNNVTELEELRFAGGASYSAVHTFDWKLMRGFLDLHARCHGRGCPGNHILDVNFKYLAEVALLEVGLHKHLAHFTHAWILDDNVEYIGDFSEFLESSESIEADVLVAKAYSNSSTDEKTENGRLVTTYGGIRRISRPVFPNVMKVVTTLNIVSDDIVYSSACVQDSLCTMKWLNDEMPSALDYAVFQEFESKATLPFLRCLHSHLGYLFSSCKAQRRMNIALSLASTCDNMYGKFISRKTSFNLEETSLFEFQFVRKCETELIPTYNEPTLLEEIKLEAKQKSLNNSIGNQQNATLQVSDKVEIPVQLVHLLKSPHDVHHGRQASWWVEVRSRAAEGFSEWDGEVIAKQFRVNSNPKVIYTVRTHKVDERVMMNLSRQAMSVARYGGHMHVIYQGDDLTDFHTLRSLLHGYMVAVHWFNPSAVQSLMQTNDNFWEFVFETCLVKHDRVNPKLRDCPKSYRKWVTKGGRLKRKAGKMLWRYAFLPEVFFLANLGPLPENSTYWNTEYDVTFTGDIASMFERTRLSSDDLIAPGEKDNEYGPFRVELKEWIWWVFAGSWAKLEDEYRLLSSAKRLSANFAARVVEAIFVNGWFAVDEIFLGTLCTVTPGCRIQPMNGNYEFHNDKLYATRSPFEEGAFEDMRFGLNALSNFTLNGLLVHKVDFLFSVCENVNLQMSYIARGLSQDSDWCESKRT